VPQPSLHEHLTCVAAPAIWLSPRSGRLTGGVDGLYVADRQLVIRSEPPPLRPARPWPLLLAHHTIIGAGSALLNVTV
jgi:hypothetical protein